MAAAPPVISAFTAAVMAVTHSDSGHSGHCDSTRTVFVITLHLSLVTRTVVDVEAS